jgi:ribose 5-phosphate isomerase B
MKIAIGCDHGGFVLKPAALAAVERQGAEAVDFGTYDESSCDYPVFALKVAETVASGEAELGILLCGTGIGISIAANKVKGIRAACVTNPFMAAATREHNNANIIALGGRVVSPEQAGEILDAFLSASFQGGRHQRRVDLISEIEDKYFK